MILPIVAYGTPILRKPCQPADIHSPALPALIANMKDTMRNAHGAGLAAPQVSVDARLFITNEEVFINPEIIWRSETKAPSEEGCLSIPGIREPVDRPVSIIIKWTNESLQERTKTFNGEMAFIIQHEYDHIEGKLYLVHIGHFRRKLLQQKLELIRKGNISCPYPLWFEK